MLKECTKFWGRVELNAERPALENHTGVTFMPLSSQVWIDDDQEWGLYDEKGNLIDAAAYRRTNASPEGFELLGQSLIHPTQFPTNYEWAEDLDYLYIGPFISHFGHFICSSLARLWPLLDVKSSP